MITAVRWLDTAWRPAEHARNNVGHENDGDRSERFLFYAVGFPRVPSEDRQDTHLLFED